MSPTCICVQVLEAQRRHQKEKSGIIPTSPTPYTYNKVTFTDFKLIYGPRGMKINNNNPYGYASYYIH